MVLELLSVTGYTRAHFFFLIPLTFPSDLRYLERKKRLEETGSKVSFVLTYTTH